jgi:hypothetical protein
LLSDDFPLRCNGPVSFAPGANLAHSSKNINEGAAPPGAIPPRYTTNYPRPPDTSADTYCVSLNWRVRRKPIVNDDNSTRPGLASLECGALTLLPSRLTPRRLSRQSHPSLATGHSLFLIVGSRVPKISLSHSKQSALPVSNRQWNWASKSAECESNIHPEIHGNGDPNGPPWQIETIFAGGCRPH